MELRANLRQEAEGWRLLSANLGAWLMQEFVVRKGIEYPARALPRRFPNMLPKYCFHNASQLLKRRRNLRYCEGYVTGSLVPISIHHAWVIDAEDQVIDPTLAEPTAYEYLGVPYTLEQYREAMRGRRTPSMFLDDAGAVNAVFLLKDCPDLRPLVEPRILALLEAA